MSKPTAPNNIFVTVLLAVVRASAGCVRLGAAAILGLLTPVVGTLLGALSLLLAATAMLFRYAAPRPDFPFWELLALALGCAIARALLDRLTRAVIGG